MEKLYSAFTNGDREIVETVTETKRKIDQDMKNFSLKFAELQVNMKNVLVQIDVNTEQVNMATKQVHQQDLELTKVKQAQDKLHLVTASKKVMLECIDKTKIMCSQFNFAV